MVSGTCGRSSGVPDPLTEEVASVLWSADWIEFAMLYLAVEASVGSAPTIVEASSHLRQETFDCLQHLVRQGFVEKRGESYRCVASRLATLRDRFATEHCRTLLRAVDATPTDWAR
jgi:hypothetical protein